MAIDGGYVYLDDTTGLYIGHSLGNVGFKFRQERISPRKSARVAIVSGGDAYVDLRAHRLRERTIEAHACLSLVQGQVAQKQMGKEIAATANS